jgi:hypothetical protein
LHITGEPGTAVLKGPSTGNRDGMEEAAHGIMRAKSHLTQRQLVEALKEAGIKRSLKWVNTHMSAATGTGVIRGVAARPYLPSVIAKGVVKAK